MKIQTVLLIFLLSVITPFGLVAGEVNALAMEQGSALLSPPAADEANRDNLPSTQTSSSSGRAWIYGGVGLAAVGAVLAIAGSGGDSDSSTETAPAATSTSTPPPEEKKVEKVTKPTIITPKDQNPAGSEPVGPDIRGSDWAGFLDLVHAERENVTSSITQNGSYVVIITSTSQKYGHKFVGNIDAGGSMKVYDQTTGEIWSTHYGPASEHAIDLYDYVDNYKALDRLYLTR